MGRQCADCNNWCDPDEFSNNQWRKGNGVSRCINCVLSGGCGVGDNGRNCAECQCFYTPESFSNNQWLKGDGHSRCSDCVNRTYDCTECGREFSSRNSLEMHAQVHRPRNVPCPVCGEQRFRSGANAVQHVESGYCSKCLGSENARAQIYRFASGKSQMNRFMTNTPLLTNQSNDFAGVPDLPYHCTDCNKSFRQMSQLLQHQDSKHDSNRLLTYY
jgi:DNA-directed RNA polymerase subunit RPC12/RpoP